MINTQDVLETINMIREENLDIRTITMGISLWDCVSEDVDRLCDKIYDKITKRAEKLVETGFVERQKSKKTVNLIPTQVGRSLITVLPEQLQSPLLTAEWEKAYGKNTLMQGCIVVRTAWAEAHAKELEQFLSDYKASIEFTNSSAKEASEMIVAAGIFAKAPIAEKAIPKCNIVYIDGNEMADALNVFFTKLYAVNPQAVGGAIPDSNIYLAK